MKLDLRPKRPPLKVVYLSLTQMFLQVLLVRLFLEKKSRQEPLRESTTNRFARTNRGSLVNPTNSVTMI
ncbi:transmembrane protein, putative [Medicago truncatula]|uniref:Transmembrane protein, putative n=1 Tax=Medicago truncatula TaxID=3880 RepID=G7KA90_MEDTR|nr:transmembrane protein, putative [Medicago truncatula]